jgi:DNA-directed RNA polymerase specialized sigma24 family protein
LISDAVFQTFRKPLRRKSTGDELRSPHRFTWMVEDDSRVSAFEELAEVVHDARQACVPSEDIELIRQLVQTGSPQLVAQQRNVTARTIRNHRARAIEHIRAALDPAA